MDILMFFKREYSKLSFSDYIFIAGGNSSGKSSMYKFIISGFEGKEKELFLVDGTQIKKNQYSILGISRDNTLDDEMKLTSKTYLMSRLETFREYVDEEKLKKTLMEYFKSIKALIKEDILINNDFDVTFDIEKVCLNIFKSIEYSLENVSFIDLSTSEKINLQLEMYLNRLASINDNTLLLFDDFDCVYTKQNFYTKLEYILSKIKGINTKCIFFIKNEDIVNELVKKGYNIMFIKDNKLINLPNYENFIDEIYLYSEEEIKRKTLEIREKKEKDIIENLLK